MGRGPSYLLFSLEEIHNEGRFFRIISYEPFFDTLRYDEISTYKLIKEHHISSSTINRLKNNKPVSTATIEKLCKVLDYDVYDIMKYESDKQN